MVALIVWYAASATQNPVRESRFGEAIPIALTPDAGFITVTRSHSSATVTLRALTSFWGNVQRDDLRLSADLRGLGEGVHTVPLVGIIKGLSGGTITRIQPEQITVELAARGEKIANVAVFFTSEAPVGYTAAAQPAQAAVRVAGAKAKVDQVHSVQARVSLVDQRLSFTKSVPLIALDQDNKPVTEVELIPPEVTVEVTVRQRADVTELTVDPQFIPGTLRPGYLRPNYSWQPLRIFVRGDPAAIAALKGVAPTEPIDLSGRRETFSQVVKVVLPEGIVMPDPTDITVTVVIEPVMLSREFAEIPVVAQGLDPADYAISFTPERVRVIVTGAQTAVNGLAADDIRVFAPLSGLTAGTHTVTLQASISQAEIKPEDVRILTETVEVIITMRTPTPTPLTP